MSNTKKRKNPSNTPATASTYTLNDNTGSSNAVSVLFCSFRSYARYNCQICFSLPSIHSHGRAPILQQHRIHRRTHARIQSSVVTTVRLRFTLPFAIFERNTYGQMSVLSGYSLCALRCESWRSADNFALLIFMQVARWVEGMWFNCSLVIFCSCTSCNMQ